MGTAASPRTHGTPTISGTLGSQGSQTGWGGTPQPTPPSPLAFAASCVTRCLDICAGKAPTLNALSMLRCFLQSLITLFPFSVAAFGWGTLSSLAREGGDSFKFQERGVHGRSEAHATLQTAAKQAKDKFSENILGASVCGQGAEEPVTFGSCNFAF